MEAEVHSPECPMDISHPFTGSSQPGDQQQVMEELLLPDSCDELC